MSKTFLKVSLSDIELLSGTKYAKNDVVCIVFLNGNCVDKLYFKYKDYQSNLALANIIEKVQLIFQAKDTGELVGSISFSTDVFIPFRGKTFAQWFTLFDSTEDDEFDGFIGEHDEDTPRALISFRIEPAPGSTMTVNSAASSMLLEQDKDNYVFTSDDPEMKDDVIPEPEKNKKAGQKSSRNLGWQKELQLPGEEVKKRKGPSESVSQNQTEDEIHVSNLEGKMSDLLNMLQSQDKIEMGSKYGGQKKEDNTINLNDYEESRELLELEIKKSTLLEETLKSAEIQLSKHEKLYEELEAKSNDQFKQLLEKNKALNEENYNLKQKISNFEVETDKTQKDHVAELDKILQENEDRSNNDKAIIERHIATNENLEKLNSDLKAQLENTIAALTQEKELSKQLQKQLEENLANNKETFASLKDKMQGYFEQLQEIQEDKANIETKNANAELKIQALETKNSAVEAEYASCKTDLEKALQEIQEHKNIANTLKESIKEISNKKDEEILSAKEANASLDEQIRKMKSQYEFLNAEKKELAEELANLKQMGYDSRINSLETALSNSEEARKNLQAQLQKSETRIQSFLQNQKEKSLVSRAYEDTIQEMREKNKTLAQQIEELTNSDDQLKFENTELKLKLDALADVNDQNTRLKEKLNAFKDDSYKQKDTIAGLRQQLFNTSTELIRQTNTALEQGNIIRELTQQMQALDNSLRVAFGDIKRMHFTLEAGRRLEKPYEPYMPRFNDELDQKISEFSNKAELPIKFIRMKPGVYAFGSRKVKIEHINGKLFIQAGGDNIPIEEFVRLYAQKELFKMKNVPEAASNNVDGENSPSGIEDKSPVNVTEGQDSSSFSPTKQGAKKRTRKDRNARQAKISQDENAAPEGIQRSPVKNQVVDLEKMSPVKTEVSERLE